MEALSKGEIIIVDFKSLESKQAELLANIEKSRLAVKWDVFPVQRAVYSIFELVTAFFLVKAGAHLWHLNGSELLISLASVAGLDALEPWLQILKINQVTRDRINKINNELQDSVNNSDMLHRGHTYRTEGESGRAIEEATTSAERKAVALKADLWKAMTQIRKKLILLNLGICLTSIVTIWETVPKAPPYIFLFFLFYLGVKQKGFNLSRDAEKRRMLHDAEFEDGIQLKLAAIKQPPALEESEGGFD